MWRVQVLVIRLLRLWLVVLLLLVLVLHLRLGVCRMGLVMSQRR